MFIRSLCLSICLAVPAGAVILSGPNGTGSGNATAASLNSFITSNSLPAFPFWNNVVTVSDASGVYLGNGWVLTAAHVTQLAVNAGSITVNGAPYTVRQNTQVGGFDLRLYRIGGEMGDPPLPALPSVGLDPTSPSIGQSFLTFGRGERAEGTANSASSSDASLAGSPAHFDWAGAGAMRWGTNNMETIPTWAGGPASFAGVLPGPTTAFVSIYDDPGAGNYLNATEAGHAVGDSGGPLFTLESGVWTLTGLSLAVAADPGAGQPGGVTGFGNLTAYANLATYKSQIEAIAIPEPAVASLAALALAGATRRRRHAR
jgi:hypothetical protein